MEIKEMLNHLYTDLLMLKDGSWVQDEHNCNESIDMVKSLAAKLNVDLHDTREPKTQRKSFKLPKEFAEKWITALRSGEYKQGVGLLKCIDYTEDFPNREIPGSETYCCLGIAGKICGADDAHLVHVELPKNEEDYFASIGLAAALLEDSDSAISNLVYILTSLNDSFTEVNLNLWLKSHPGLKFRDISALRRKLERKDNISTATKFSFEEIANFIEDNTEFI